MPDTTRHLHLPNGLHITVRHAPHLTRTAAAMRVRAGSHDAPARWPGLAHFLEHLLFLGTARFPLDDGLMRFVQGAGGQVNASTRERTTEFFFEAPCAAFAGALERLCQMLAEPDLGVGRQLAEREVIHAEFIAWSRDAQAQRQFALLQAVSPAHPLRGFHAGNRYTLNVPSPAFQNALQAFHRQFYRGAQMTLSLCGPLPLDALQAMAERSGRQLPAGPLVVQAPAPPLLDSSQRLATCVGSGLLFAHECLPPGSEPALGLLFHHLTDPSPGGWLAEMERRQWLRRAKAQTLYAFAGQALWHLELTGSDPAMTDRLQASLRNWFGWLRQLDPTQLHAAFSAVQRRKGLTASALQWARSDSSGQPFEGLDEQGLAALGQILDGLSGEDRQAFSPEPSPSDALLPKPVRRDGSGQCWAITEPTPPSADLPRDSHARDCAATASWHLPEPEPLLLESLPRATGLALTQALHIDTTLPSHRQFGCLRLRWRLPCPQPALEPVLTAALTPLQARAEQAGVTLRLDSVGALWTLLCSGPPAAVVRTSRLALDLLRQPPGTAWQLPPHGRPALMPIRALLEHLPRAVQRDEAQPDSESAAVDNPAADSAPCATQAVLDTLWAGSQWHGHATGFAPGALPALADAVRDAPGTAKSGVPPAPRQTRRWHPLLRASGEPAVLLFCPVRPDQQAIARLLGHLLQGPVYQRLRVELQLGYAVFSAFRQVEGVPGLLFGVQSPHTPPQQIVVHLRAVLAAGATFSDEATAALAEQFDAAEMTNDDLAHWAWQRHLTGESGGLETLRAGIEQATQADIDGLITQLMAPDAPWLCLSNRLEPNPTWC